MTDLREKLAQVRSQVPTGSLSSKLEQVRSQFRFQAPQQEEKPVSLSQKLQQVRQLEQEPESLREDFAEILKRSQSATDTPALKPTTISQAPEKDFRGKTADFFRETPVLKDITEALFGVPEEEKISFEPSQSRSETESFEDFLRSDYATEVITRAEKRNPELSIEEKEDILDFAYNQDEREVKLGNQGILGFMYEGLLKSDYQKIQDRYEKLRLAGVPEDRATKIAVQVVTENNRTFDERIQRSMEQKLAEEQGIELPDEGKVEITEEEQAILKREGFKEAALQTLEGLDFIGVGSIARKGVTTVGAPALKRLAKLTEREAIFGFLDNLFSKVDDVPEGLVNDITDAVYDIQKTENGRLGSTQTQIDQAIARVLRDSDKGSVVTRKAGDTVIQLYDTARAGARTGDEVAQFADEVSDIAENSLKRDATGARKVSLDALRDDPAKVAQGEVRLRQLEDGRVVIEDGRHRLEVARETGVLPRVVDVTGEYDQKIVSDKVQELVNRFDNLGGKLTDETAVGARFAGETTQDVAARSRLTDNILPPDVSIAEEAKAIGSKRIAPDRVPHQQLTPEEGIEALIESSTKQKNKRVASYSEALEKLKTIQERYGNKLPARTKGNLSKYPNLAEDVRIWQQLKRYSINGKIEDAISRFERFARPQELSAEKIAEIRASATKEYINLIKKDISKGYKFPDEVLDFDPSFRKATDSRARYEKGLHTSFSADDSRIVFDEEGRITAGMKRQDGKELTQAQKNEIIEGVLQTQKALGIDLNKLASDERWVYVHLNDKNPFLTKNAAGLYRKDAANKSVSISLGGIERYQTVVDGKTVTKRINNVASHELGHALDYQTGNKLLDSESVFKLRSTYKPVENSFRGRKYWSSSEEVKARAIEQYVAIAEGHTDYFNKEGYWNEEIFNDVIKPAVDDAVDTHFAEYKKAVDELPSFDAIERDAANEAGFKGAVSSPQEVIPAAEKVQRKVSGTEPDGVTTAAKKLDGVKEIPKTPAKSARFATKNNPPLQLNDETIMGYLQRKIQDKFNRLNYIQKKISNGLPLSDDLNAYLQQEMFHGRAANRIDKFEADIIASKGKQSKALLERMSDDGISIEDMGEFLHAKHAPARNKRVASINDAIPDGGSGLTNKKAAEIIEKFRKSGQLEKMEAYAEEVYEKVVKARLKILEEEHLLKPEAIDNIANAFEDGTYVPLKIADKQSMMQRLRGGKGFDVRGKDVRRLKGSTNEERTNPLIQAIMDYEDTVIKAEKNKVGRTLKELVEKNPDVVNAQGEKLWEVKAQQYSPVYNKLGEVEYVKPANYKLADNVMEVRDKGKIYHITINDEALASAMKNLGTERSIKFFHQINNYLRAVTTFYNPEFMITNFERDIQAALINTAGEQGTQAATRVAKDVPSALRGIWRETRGKGSATLKKGSVDWVKEYEELKEVGGRVGWFDYATVAEKQAKIQKRINTASGKKPLDKAARTWDGVAEWVSDINESVESGVRLSAYVNAKKAGMTKEQAASLAKNLTVNFNKKGEWGTAINSLYLFANAGIQGTARLFTALRHKRTRRIVAGIAAFSYGVNYMNEQVNGEAYDKISDFEKNTNLIFVLPAGADAPEIDAAIGSVETIPNSDERYIKIKLPYGYNIFKVMGDVAYEMSLGGQRVGDSLKRLVFAADESFNPLSSGSAAQLVSPTVSDPFVQMYENKNYFGGNIKPEQGTYDKKKKDSDLYFSSVREPSRVFTEWLNDVTGGNSVESGFIDISPENVDHIIDFLGGGVGKFFANTLDTGVSLAEGEVPDVDNTPFVRKFVGEVYEDAERSLMYDLLDKGETKLLTDNEFKDFLKYGSQALQEGSIDEKRAKAVVTDMVGNQRTIHAARILEEMRDGNAATSEQKKEIFDAYVEKNDIKNPDAILKEVASLSKGESSSDDRGFIGDLVAGGRGLLVDPQNVLKAMFTKEKLGEVEGNLVELQRFYGLDFTEDGGSQEKKAEMMRELGLNFDTQAGDYKLEHITPVKAGGGNADKNLKIVTTEEHDSYTPIDIAVINAVKGKLITRKEATELMTKLKVDKTLTAQEVYDQLRAKQGE